MSRTMIAPLLALASLVATSVMSPPARAGLIHDYEFNGTYADTLGGPALVPAGGMLDPFFQRYDFLANQGLSLSNALPNNSVYTIDMSFFFSDLTFFRKILDFKNLTPENGLYNFNTMLQLLRAPDPTLGGPNAALAPTTYARVDVTRDASSLLVIYVNGAVQISINDTGKVGVFDGPNSIIQFFKDDIDNDPIDASAGVVSQIRIYDTALSPDQVRGLGGPKLNLALIPEPSGLVLLGTGAVGLLGYMVRRRSRRSA
jgi:hypothetical protein